MAKIKKGKSRKFAYRSRKGVASRLFDFKGVKKFFEGVGKKLNLF